MLKIVDEKYDEILKKLKMKQLEGGQIVLRLSKFAFNEYQNICVNTHMPNHVSEYHTHEFFEVNYVQKGNCINLVEDESIHMNKGDIIIIHPGVFHTLYANVECRVYNFLIKKEWLYDKIKYMPTTNSCFNQFFRKSVDDDFYKYAVYPCSLRETDPVSKSAEKVIKSSEQNSLWFMHLMEAAFIEFLCALDEKGSSAYLSGGRGSSSSKMINILMYMTENYDEVTLEDVAERFFYSKTHICRLFLKNTGKSFNQTLTDMKINRACSYLKNTSLSIEQVSAKIGYGSSEYFQRLFKKKIGMTPNEFRQASATKRVKK